MAKARVNFTAGRIADFQCEDGKSQSFLWDSTATGLGLRVTAGGAKSYIFQARLNGQAMRIAIGSLGTWTIDKAQAEARRLKVIIDGGRDPRVVKVDGLEAEQEARDIKATQRIAKQAREAVEAVTLGDVWPLYVSERRPLWSERHTFDHEKMIQAGGEKRKRSPKLTEPGPLASLADVRLVDLTSARVEAWARVEVLTRPTRARLALRLLKACLNWCADNPDYADISTTNAAKSKKARESLGRAKVKNDVLQREQLATWFTAVRQIENSVISAYLQCLLITGARREELAHLQWGDVDFQWNSLVLKDKVEDFRIVPLTPYVVHLLRDLKRRNEAPPTVRRLRTLETRNIEWQPSAWVFQSITSATKRLIEPGTPHTKALKATNLPHLTLHGLRRSFATLSEWVECPAGIAAQIQGHAPQGVRESNYIRRPLDLLRKWHVKIEAWMLEQAGIDSVAVTPGLRLASESVQRDTSAISK